MKFKKINCLCKAIGMTPVSLQNYYVQSSKKFIHDSKEVLVAMYCMRFIRMISWAIWWLFQLRIYREFPVVYYLSMHFPGKQPVWV